MNQTIKNIDQLITDLTVISDRCTKAASVLDEIRDTVDDIVRAKTEVVGLEANTSEDDDKEFLEYCKRLLNRKEHELSNLLKNKEYIEANLRVIKEFANSIKAELPQIDTEYDI